MPIAYVLINSDLGTDVSIITKIKEILTEKRCSIRNSRGLWRFWYYFKIKLYQFRRSKINYNQ